MGGGSSVAYPLKKEAPLNGIFAAMRKANGGKVGNEVKVKVSSKSVRCFADPMDVVGPSNDNEWTSENEDNSWIEITFATKKVELHGYTLKTFQGGKGSTHPRSWKVEVSNDGVDYRQVDQVTETDELNNSNKTFSKVIQPTGQFSIVRFTMTGKNSFGSNCFTLANIELFGNLK
ncbi:hypothetical protein TVAG_004030 [Trichomonas vaginalis G3]|uniref:F5/8 type C domain-containing protein n=1 Tax=Trichomonas vaginalis (strain ATCC PRA-98 / G3) TaxID=412133 RepID=A2E5B7_TRIV3|nr:protein ubiquitination [Trichomonas vaginalis G3]EAY12197.1 hypothetical protein TVAG_004030 [Trichomonas vaginalis G3]KAI5515403.1 protein ubiquitination [Trichomonas vaginalis G3]|eukprot:XP_001324420.1 hypothetical protein [Trichomonas vaginalis G3]